ncbi:MAG: sigma-54-dependent Fis family transcriptional regulator [Desulfarculus sp.]|nr:sigma-54-dependent Fis family transcriptional regulator [Desulfarculus sp.]
MTDHLSQIAAVLVVDDDPAILAVLEARLASAGLKVLTARSGEEALALLEREPVDLVVSDQRMPGISGKELFRQVHAARPALPFILLTAHGRIPEAVEMVKEGASDYLTKPFEGRELLAKVQALLAARAHAGPSGAAPAPQLAGGASPAMARLLEMIERVAPSEVSVLILGESGTGKEVVARLIHQKSRRSAGPLVVVDCGSTPANLLESELFGHLKGSFTHALKDKKGLIQEAQGGTLFLDEIGNIGPEMQTRLLRFLQEGTIRPVGGTKNISVDSRVIAATNADLPELIKRGAFREDLYFRIKGITLHLPALRQRREDIPALARQFLARLPRPAGAPACSLSPQALRTLVDYPWPGNVRELKHVMEAGAVLCQGGVIEPQDLQLEPSAQPAAPAAGGQAAGPGEALPLSLDENERLAILRALTETGWVLSEAAELLGISRRTIHYKVKKYGLTPPPRR